MLAVLLLCLPQTGRCAAPDFAGVYVVIDPHNTNDLQNLQNAASAGCSTATALTTPFCGASSTQYVSGVYLRVHWCSWELANVTLGSTAGQSCYYIVNSGGGTPISTQAGPSPSPCVTVTPLTQYDTCGTSPFTAALVAISTINTARNNHGLNPLQLSLGLAAGASSAMRFIYNPTSPPVTYDVAANAAGNFCIREPNIWDPNYVQAYWNAVDNLISTVQGYSSLSKSIYTVKLGAGNFLTDEYDTGGFFLHIATATDSGTYEPVSTTAISCPIDSAIPNTGAGTLLDGYHAQINTHLTYTGSTPSYPDCRGYATIAQGTECVFGVLAGHIRGTLKNDKLYAALEAIPTNNGNVLPYVACGTSGAGEPTGPVCVVQGMSPSAAADQWSVYYLYQEVADLLTTGTVAQSAAKWAFADTGAGTSPSFTNLVTITWTNLSEPPSGPGYNFFTDPANTTEQSAQQVGCALNNTVSTPPPATIAYKLNRVSTPVVGVGTELSWQTNAGPLGATYCTVAYNPTGGYTGETEYGPILSSGYLNGGSFIEVFPDVAFASNPATGFTGYLSQCAPDLAHATAWLRTNASVPGVCLY